MGGCVKNRHCLNRSRHLQKKSRHWTCYTLDGNLLCACYGLAASHHEAGFIFCAKESPVTSGRRQRIFLKNSAENFSQQAHRQENTGIKRVFPVKSVQTLQLFVGKSGKHTKWTGPTTHLSNWEFSSAAYTKNRQTSTMSVYRYTTTYMENTMTSGCLTRRTCDNRTVQYSVSWMSYSIEVGIVHPEQKSRTSVRVITPFPVKFRLIIAALCRIIYIIM